MPLLYDDDGDDDCNRYSSPRKIKRTARELLIFLK
jgi:hypothetical protein